MRHIIIVLLFISCVFAAGARVDLKYDYLHAGIAPRIQALGETGMISAEGPESIYYNPALLVFDTDKTLLVGMTNLGYDQQQFFAYYRLPIAYRNALFSIGLVSHQISGIEVRNASNAFPQNMTASDMMLVMGISRFLGPRTSFGMSLQWMLDDYTTDHQVGVNFLFGLSHYYSDKVRANIIFRYLGEGQMVAGSGVRLSIGDQLILYSTADLFLSDGLNQVILHNGLAWSVTSGFELLVGCDGANLSFGATQCFDGFAIQLSYTDTPIGSRYSVGIELL